MSKGVGGKTTQSRLQNVDYTYNIRGWLKQINDVNNMGNDLFSFKLNYNSPTSGTALYNGNISQTQWKSANTDNSLKTYTYGYDALNRITSGIDNTGNYNLTAVAYDKNGNITTLARKGHTNINATSFGNMDNLIYTYQSNSNKLAKVVDTSNSIYGFKDGTNTGDDYSYDVNGNLKLDNNKGILDIQYNHLNLPVSLELAGATAEIRYIYDATGVKLQKVVDDDGDIVTTDYAGNFIYEDDQLQFFSHPEGYIEPDGSGGYNYIYQYKDHLGNIRLSYTDVNQNNSSAISLTIKEENNYYPFGLKHKGYNNVQNGRDHKYGFGNKEEQDELGLGWQNFGWRNYDATLGRWMNLDPFAERYNSISPYIYVGDSPIKLSDPDGRQIVMKASKDDIMNLINSFLNSSETSGELSFKIENNEDGSAYGVIIDGYKPDDDSSEISNALANVINSDEVVEVILQKDNPAEIEKAENHGGAVFSAVTKKGKKRKRSIFVMADFLRNDTYYAAKYRYIKKSNSFWKDDKTLTRPMTFFEAFMHEIIHASKDINGERNTENDVRKIMNSYRRKNGIIERGTIRSATFWEILWGASTIENLKSIDKE